MNIFEKISYLTKLFQLPLNPNDSSKNLLMKKILLITLSVVSCAYAFGQTTASDEPPIRLSILAGAGLSKNTGYYGEGIKSKPVYSIGVGVTKPFSDAFEVQSRLLLDVKHSGVKYSFSLTDGDNNTYDMTDDVTTKANYFTLQVLPTFRFGKARAFFVGAGGYYSRLNGNSVDIDRHNETTGTDSHMDSVWGDQFEENYDAGITVMAGYTIKISDGNGLDIQIMYNKGLVDVHDMINVSQRFNSINVTIGYKILGNSGRQ